MLAIQSGTNSYTGSVEAPGKQSRIPETYWNALVHCREHQTRYRYAASIAILSKKVEQPRNIDMNELKRVIRYLKGTRELKLKLNDKRNNNEKLIAFSDANWAEDRTDRKSTSGHYCNLNGGTISWFSRKQNIIALSSCEAEYVALAET